MRRGRFCLRAANGDARGQRLNALEIAVDSASEEDGKRMVSLSSWLSRLSRNDARYDRLGDMHYDTISAFIKSVRASDPDAAIYYLARMIDAGEDPMFIARRLVILAAEDIGLANPNGLAVAVAAQQAVSFIGMPEGRIPLAEATIFLASAPKSNSAYLAIDKALGLVRQSRDEPVPMHLRNAPTRLMENMGYGKDYQYPHDAPGHFKPSENLPEAVKEQSVLHAWRVGCGTADWRSGCSTGGGNATTLAIEAKRLYGRCDGLAEVLLQRHQRVVDVFGGDAVVGYHAHCGVAGVY